MRSTGIRKGDKRSLRKIARHIKLVILDVDGVLTDGGIILDNQGNELKSFHVRDGHGIKMLIRAGLRVAIITGRKSKVVERRAQELGITDVYQKCYDKMKAFSELSAKYSLSGNQIAFIGDDIVDAPLMKKVALPVTVADADEEAKKCALLITRQKGGKGAVREVSDFIIKAQGLWERIINGDLTA